MKNAAGNRRSRVSGPRPEAQCRAGATRAGIVALPFGLLRARLREILGNPQRYPRGRRSLRVPVGSAVRQRPGHAQLPEGRNEIDKLAPALLDLEKQIPPDISWVLRVDGHTDVRPIASAQFPSNWELSSAARAISVVQYLVIAQGRAAAAAGRRRFRRIPAARHRQDSKKPSKPQPPHLELKWLTER